MLKTRRKIRLKKNEKKKKKKRNMGRRFTLRQQQHRRIKVSKFGNFDLNHFVNIPRRTPLKKTGPYFNTLVRKKRSLHHKFKIKPSRKNRIYEKGRNKMKRIGVVEKTLIEYSKTSSRITDSSCPKLKAIVQPRVSCVSFMKSTGRNISPYFGPLPPIGVTPRRQTGCNLLLSAQVNMRKCTGRTNRLYFVPNPNLRIRASLERKIPTRTVKNRKRFSVNMRFAKKVSKAEIVDYSNQLEKHVDFDLETIKRNLGFYSSKNRNM